MGHRPANSLPPAWSRRRAESFITTYAGPRRPRSRERSAGSNGTVWLDAGQRPKRPQRAPRRSSPARSASRGVPEDVWDFQIGGYQVWADHKWLKDRTGQHALGVERHQRTTRRSSTALNETICIMAAIDEVIEAHGGWPDAFQAGVGGGCRHRSNQTAPKVAPVPASRATVEPSDTRGPLRSTCVPLVPLKGRRGGFSDTTAVHRRRRLRMGRVESRHRLSRKGHVRRPGRRQVHGASNRPTVLGASSVAPVEGTRQGRLS